MNRLDRKNIIAACAAFFVLFCFSGCDTKDDTTQGQCTDAQCYGICQTNAWAGMTQSYWVFTAFCTDKSTCSCFSACGDDLCDAYCKDEKAASGGYCDFLSCTCIYPAKDAGADAADDAGADASE